LPARIRRAPLGRLALPVLLAVWTQADVWAGRPFGLGHMVGPRPLVAVLYAVTSLALVWRERAPLAVLAFVVAADSAEYLAFGAPQGLGSLLPLLVAFYAVGRYSPARNVVVAAPLTALGMAIHELKDPQWSFGGAVAFFWLVLAMGWPLGYAFRRHALQAAALVEERDASARAAVGAERARIARELHDVVGHGLSVIVLQLVAALGVLEHGDARAVRDRLLGVERSARDALAEMRRLLDLVDDGAAASLAPQPGLVDVDRLVADTRAAGGSIEVSVSGERPELPPGVDLAAFRILQESLTNVLKHARPPRARVQIGYEPDAVVLEVVDEGLRSDGENPRGRGLAGMRERASLYGGVLEVGPRREGGYRVRARLPLGG
jgi:signal transduction histidine kinase